MTRYLSFIAALFLTVTAVSCEDFESAISRSETSPVIFENTLYWNGYKVGKVRDLDSEERLKARRILTEKSFYSEPIRETFLNKTKLSGLALVNLQKRDVVWIVEMSYRDTDNSPRESKVFLVNIASEDVTDITSHAGSLSFDDDNNDFTTPLKPVIESGMKPDMSMFADAAASGIDYRNDFETRKTIMIGGDTVKNKRNVLINFNVGYEIYSVYPLRDSDFKGKADTTLRLSIKPIKVVHAHADAAFPLLFFETDFKYDFFSGGKTYTGKDASADKSIKSYLFDLSGGFYGVQSRLTLEQWDFGRADYYTSGGLGTRTRDVYQYTIPFTLKKRQLDLTYHFGWRNFQKLGGEAREGKMWDWFVGYRYISFNKPAIVFTSEDVKDQDGKVVGTNLTGETLPQEIKMNSNLVGIGIDNLSQPMKAGFSYLAAGDFYAGNTHTKFFAVESRTKMPQRVDMNAGCLASGASLGARYNFINGICDVSLSAGYRADLYMILLDKDYSTEYDSYIFQTFSVSATASF
jgi:hypothetical protein